MSTFRFIFLFTSALPFYNFLQVIGVVIGLGWVREEKERAPEGLTSDISLSSLAFEGNAFSETPYFQIFQGGKPSDARAFGARDYPPPNTSNLATALFFGETLLALVVSPSKTL